MAELIKYKKAVVTGAASGIGLELVKLLLAQGCTVVAAVLESQSLTLSHEKLFIQSCDVSRPDNLEVLFERALKEMGAIDIFIANAGFAYYEKLGKPDLEHIRRIFETNTFSTVYSAQKMKEICGEKPYQFVCTASAMGLAAIPGYALYSSSKAAIRGFSEAYRYELGKDQHFQVVYPIATRTAFFKQAGNSPMIWPSQSVETVAESILRGIKSKRKDIYPSKLFSLILISSRIFPFILKIYKHTENKKLTAWLKERRVQ